MRAHQDDEMPAELHFSGSGRAGRPVLADGPVTVVLSRADGGREERSVRPGQRPDHEAAGPRSVAGVVDEVLHFVYNPDNDFVSMRLVSSFDEQVELEDEDANGIRALRSKTTGRVVGMTVRGYFARFGARDRLGADTVELTVRSGLSLFAKALQAA